VRSPFSKQTLVVVISITVLSLIVAIVLTVSGGDFEGRGSAGADAYSVSALGHRGLVELLGRLDVPVIVSRGDSGDKAKHGLLIIAEPKIHSGDEARLTLRVLATGAPRTLVVLPKWYGTTKPGARWIERGMRLPLAEVESAVRSLDLQGAVDRGHPPPSWAIDGTFPQPLLHTPQTLTSSNDLEPVIYDRDRVLLGRIKIGEAELWVLTDPDAFNNAGLHHAENARFMVDLIDQLRHDGPVVFDETVHGHARKPGLLRVLFSFPLILATLQVLFIALIAIWAAMVRFGPRRSTPPPLAPGKDYLIRNTAALLRFGGHHAASLRRYLANNIQTVRNLLHAPESLSPAELVAWLERVRLLRGGKISLPDLEAAVAGAASSPHRVVELADTVHRWRLEMTYGTRDRS
jgi:hypothetical protein